MYICILQIETTLEDFHTIKMYVDADEWGGSIFDKNGNLELDFAHYLIQTQLKECDYVTDLDGRKAIATDTIATYEILEIKKCN